MMDVTKVLIINSFIDPTLPGGQITSSKYNVAALVTQHTKKAKMNLFLFMTFSNLRK